MKRRSFLKLVAALPFVGSLVPKEVPLPPAVISDADLPTCSIMYRGFYDCGVAIVDRVGYTDAVIERQPG